MLLFGCPRRPRLFPEEEGTSPNFLVIAADESVMPQTREHLDICSLLHIKQGFTVLTKIDNVEAEMIDLVEEEVREFLKGSFLENSPVLRVSSLTGEGIPKVIETVNVIFY